MQIIFVTLAITFTAVLTVPLAVIAIGIRRQERAGSLSIRPRGRTAAVTRKLLDLHAAGRLRAVPGGRYPLEHARRAHQDLAARRTQGKLLLDPTLPA